MSRLPLLLIASLVCTTGCSPKKALIGVAANALAGGEGPGWGADDDPELIASATPFALKTMEGLLGADPENPQLLLGACSGFTQYGYGFVQQPAQRDEALTSDQKKAVALRVKRLLLRAQGYCWRALELEHEGFKANFEKDPAKALAELEKEDVPALYWAAATLALRVSGQKDDPKVLVELPNIGLMAERALALDEKWGDGSIHELMEAYESSRPAAMGGSAEKALVHRDRALVLSRNLKLGPWVTWAESVSVAKQDRKEFDRLIEQVLAFDLETAPDYRLSNVLAQRQAAWLKAKAAEGDLFVE